MPSLRSPGAREELAARVARDIPEGLVGQSRHRHPDAPVGNYVPKRPARSSSIRRTASSAWARRRAWKRLNPWLINASRQHVTLVTGASLYESMPTASGWCAAGHLRPLRAGRVSRSPMGGDLANWARSDDDNAPAIGGAMDLAAGAKRVWVVMEHTARPAKSASSSNCAYPPDRDFLRQARLHRPRGHRRRRQGLCRARHGARHFARRPPAVRRRRAFHHETIQRHCASRSEADDPYPPRDGRRVGPGLRRAHTSMRFCLPNQGGSRSFRSAQRLQFGIGSVGEVFSPGSFAD